MGRYEGKAFPYAPIGCSALLFLLPFCTQEELANAVLPFRDVLPISFRYCYHYRYNGHKKIQQFPMWILWKFFLAPIVKSIRSLMIRMLSGYIFLIATAWFIRKSHLQSPRFK